MTLEQFINQNLGKIQLTPDPLHGINGQCVNLASSWSMAQGGPELSGATAWLIFQNFRDPFYDVINGSAGIQPGEIVFFYPNNGAAGTGDAGHVDIAVDTITTSGFRGLDTNWSGNPQAAYATHSNNGVAGRFRPKGGNKKMDKLGVQLAVMTAYDRAPTQQEFDSFIGAPVDDVLHELFFAPEHRNLINVYYFGLQQQKNPGTAQQKVDQIKQIVNN